MTYNTDRRKPLKDRAAFLESHGCICHWCKLPITDDLWDDEHIIPREMFPPGGGADAMSNRAPIHRGTCHKAKTAQDRKVIAKSNRIRQRHGLDPVKRKPKPQMKSRPFAKNGPKQKIPGRPFPSRRSS